MLLVSSFSFLSLFFTFFLILVCEAIGTAGTPVLLCQLRVIVKMIVKKQMECRLAWETNRSSRRKPAQAPLLSITKSHMTRPGFEPWPPRWEAGDYLLFLLFIWFVRFVIMKMIVEKQMECRLAGETEALGGKKTCPSATFVHHKIPHDQNRG
jgi:hypothetical protein